MNITPKLWYISSIHYIINSFFSYDLKRIGNIWIKSKKSKIESIEKQYVIYFVIEELSKNVYKTSKKKTKQNVHYIWLSWSHSIDKGLFSFFFFKAKFFFFFFFQNFFHKYELCII